MDFSAQKGKLTFPRQLRLLESNQYQTVFDQNNLRASCKEILVLAKTNQSPLPRLGLVVAKKNIRRAVERNRFKRIVRESFRLRQHQIPAADIIVLARKGADNLDPVTLRHKIDKLWAQLEKKQQSFK